MIKISTAQRESLKLSKPATLQILIEKISLVYDIKQIQLVLTYENDIEEQVLLMTETEYSVLLNNPRDFQLTAYIKPLSQRQKFAFLSFSSLCLTYTLMKYATIKSLSVSVGDNSGYLMYFFVDVFGIVGVILKALFNISLWVPFIGSIGHWLYLAKNFFFGVWKNRTFKGCQIGYLGILAGNFLPNVIGYLFTMFLIAWLCIVYFHVLLHRPKPRTEKDRSFLKVVGYMIAAGVLRLNNF